MASSHCPFALDLAPPNAPLFTVARPLHTLHVLQKTMTSSTLLRIFQMCPQNLLPVLPPHSLTVWPHHTPRITHVGSMTTRQAIHVTAYSARQTRQTGNQPLRKRLWQLASDSGRLRRVQEAIPVALGHGSCKEVNGNSRKWIRGNRLGRVTIRVTIRTMPQRCPAELRTR